METDNTPDPTENTATPPAASESSVPPQPDATTRRRHYSLWELVRHKDDDIPQPDCDPNASLLSSAKPSIWPD